MNDIGAAAPTDRLTFRRPEGGGQSAAGRHQINPHKNYWRDGLLGSCSCLGNRLEDGRVFSLFPPLRCCRRRYHRCHRCRRQRYCRHHRYLSLPFFFYPFFLSIHPLTHVALI